MIAAAAIPMELDLSSSEEIGADAAHYLAEQNAAMEDADAAAYLESPDEEHEGLEGQEHSSAIAGTIGPAAEVREEVAVEPASEAVTSESADADAAPATEVNSQVGSDAPDTEAVVEQPATAAPSSIPDTSSLTPAIRDFSIDLRDAVLGVQAAQEEFDAQKEVMKECRDALKAAQKRFLRVGLKGIETFPLFDRVVREVQQQQSASDKPAAATSAECPVTSAIAKPAAMDSTIPPTSSPDAWKSVPVSALIEFGVSKKTVEFLSEQHGVTTMGKLEAARADTMNRGLLQFKGIGRAKADKIEEAILAWLTENRDSAVLNSATTATTATAGSTAETARVDEAPSAVTSTPPDTPLAESAPASPAEPTADVTPKSLRARAKELRNANVKFPFAPALDDQGFWESGRAAFEAGTKLTECAWTAGEKQDDWLRGWMAAEELSKE